MIEIQHLHKRFGDATAVNGVSFTAPDAAITGLARSRSPEPALGRRVTELVIALELDELADRRVEGFSRGERLKVALGRDLAHAPQHLVLDEPTNGLDVASASSLSAA